jgi:hypothetical protein
VRRHLPSAGPSWKGHEWHITNQWEQAMTLADLWKRACRADGIDPETRKVFVFKPNNPWAYQAATEVELALAKARLRNPRYPFGARGGWTRE